MRRNKKNIEKILKERLDSTDLEHEKVCEEYLEKTLFSGFNDETDLFVFLRNKDYSILNDIVWETSDEVKGKITEYIKKLPEELFLSVDELIIADNYDFHAKFDNYPVDDESYLGVAQKEINRIVINLDNIRNICDYHLEFYHEVLMTLIHEIGHLIISNPFLELSDYVDFKEEFYNDPFLTSEEIEEELVEEFALTYMSDIFY